MKNNKIINKILTYIKGLFQVNENEKASTLILTLLIFVGLAVYGYLTSKPHTMDSNLSTTIIGLGGIIAGMNIGNSIINKSDNQQ